MKIGEGKATCCRPWSGTADTSGGHGENQLRSIFVLIGSCQVSPPALDCQAVKASLESMLVTRKG